MAEVLPFRRNLPTSWKQILEFFITWKKAEGRSRRTIQDYCDHVTRFFHRYPDAYPDHLREAVLSYMAEDIAPGTYNLRRQNLRAFFTWLHREGIIQNNPADGLKKRRDPGRVVDIPSDILAQLVALPDRNSYAGIRDLAFILLTLDSGIRPGEAFSILPGDANIMALEIHIRPETAKTRTRRTVILSPVTAKAIQDLILARHPAWGSSVPLFCSSEGRPLTRNTWGDRLEMYSKKLGCKIRPYDLRHAFALQFLRNGGNVFALQRIMGHSDLTMTRRYLALTGEDLKAEHGRASPVLQLIPERIRVRKIR